jgi:very-short-patch-repair endonuclease
MFVKKTKEEYIEKAKLIHKEKYDYKLIENLPKRDFRVNIICPDHGVFEQSFHKHLCGDGCKKCGTERLCKLRKDLAKEKFEREARIKHNDKYDYSKSVYVRANKKLIITCKEHGDFEQTPNGHLSSGYGCIKCANQKTKERISIPWDVYKSQLNRVHNNKYDYSKVVWEGVDVNIVVVCPKHGDFKIRPAYHKNGRGCNKCSKESRKYYNQLNTEKFIKRAKEIHRDEYEYSKVDYFNSNKKVIIICKKHGEFEQLPSNHYKYGCLNCVYKTEQKFYEEMVKIYPRLQRQFKKEWCKNKTYLPFDFVIPEHNIIIEVDGRQHFKQVLNWQSPEYTQKIDVYKMKCANENNYSVIRIIQTDIWEQKYDWISELVKNI